MTLPSSLAEILPMLLIVSGFLLCGAVALFARKMGRTVVATQLRKKLEDLPLEDFEDGSYPHTELGRFFAEVDAFYISPAELGITPEYLDVLREIRDNHRRRN